MKKPEIPNDKELWDVLNKLWEEQATGANAITYPDDPNIIDAKVMYQAGIDYCFKEMMEQFIEWVKENSYTYNVSPSEGDYYCMSAKFINTLQLEERDEGY